MERQDKKVIMTAYGEKLAKAIAREKSIKMEKENDKYLLKALLAEKASGIPFENEVYENYDLWIELIQKQIAKSDNTLENIEFKKVLVEAIAEYTTR